MQPHSSFVSRVVAGALLGVSALASVARTSGRHGLVEFSSFAPVHQAHAAQRPPTESKGAHAGLPVAQQIPTTIVATDGTLLDEVGG